MRPIPLPLTDATLRLTLPFPSMGLPVRVLALVLLFAALAGILRLLYRAELKLVAPRFARVLFALRTGLVLALLFLLVCDPILARTVSEDVPGRVLIAVDKSDSMRVTDPGRAVAEKLRVARATSLASDLTTETQLDGWIQQADTSGEVRFSVIGGQEDRNRFLKVIERMNAVTRLQVAERVLTPAGQRLIDALKEKHAVDVVAFGQETSGLPPDAERLAAALAPKAAPGQVAFTDLKLPLVRAAEGAFDAVDAPGPRLLGVILITDGRHNWGDPPTARARDLAQRDVPVFAVVVAPDQAPADVAVVSAQAAAGTVFKGSVVPVEAQVRVTGWPKGPIKVTMTRPDGPNGEKREPLESVIPHDGKDNTYPVAFKAAMDTPGPHRLLVTADGGENDKFPENNARSARVNVVKDRAKVMIIDGDARWEFHYLHTCLGRDPNMDVRSVVFRQPRLNAVKDEADLRKMGIPATKLPADAEVLTTYDCVILGDVEPAQLPAADRVKLEQYVAEAGGTLIIVAGKRAVPAAYAADEADPIRKLLPIKNPKAITSDEGFPLSITPEGERAWFLSMGDTAAQNRAAWDRFPPFYWAAGGELKDAAEVLAAAPGGEPNTRAIIARQSYGFGRVLYIGVDSTWRWRFRAGDFYHHRFWGQAAQWAASDRLLPMTNATGTLRFGTREPAYTGGQDVEIVVRAAEAVKKLAPQALKGAKIVRVSEKAGEADRQVALIPLTHPDGRPRDLVGKIRDLPPGRYAVELEIPEWADELVGPPGPDGRAGGLRCPFEVLPPDNEELTDLAANRPLLEELAGYGGGKVLGVDRVGEIIAALQEKTAKREFSEEKPLRKTWWLFGIILTFLAAEWAVRKWAGLP